MTELSGSVYASEQTAAARSAAAAHDVASVESLLSESQLNTARFTSAKDIAVVQAQQAAAVRLLNGRAKSDLPVNIHFHPGAGSIPLVVPNVVLPTACV